MEIESDRKKIDGESGIIAVPVICRGGMDD